jgi:5-methylcytosine-specific restriction protein B
MAATKAHSCFILTQYSDSKYDDIEGEQYQYDNQKPNSRKLLEGSKFIIQSKIDNQNCFVGYGKIGSIDESPGTNEKGKSITKFVAKFSEYKKFDPPKLRTEQIYSDMKSMKAYGSQPPSLLPITRGLYAKITGQDLEDDEEVIPGMKSGHERIIEVLMKKKNIILYGPPGTGKTYTASKLADSLTNGENNQITFVTFHQSYGYEEFIEGIRPKSVGTHVEYPIEKGIFYQICKDAEKSDKDFVLIIDEINRGNISKIFGELITVIENNKRGKKVTLAYSKEEFSVPDNVYIIGTMNTADQSLTHLDAALKRRFSSFEIMPDSSILKGGISGLPRLLDEINSRIREKRSRDNQIGHSYFMDNNGDVISSIQDLQFVFATDIIPLLRDYFYDNEEDLKYVLGEQFIDWKENSGFNLKEDWQTDSKIFKEAVDSAYSIKI